jgi:L-glyceraldehyde 3-phosphate reductase
MTAWSIRWKSSGIGSIVFSPLAQGMLTTKYLGGIPTDSRAAQNHFLKKDFIRPSIIDNIKKLNEIAEKRGQTLAQMAIAWVLRGGRITSALIGASRSSQIVDCVAALKNDTFTAEELAEIDVYAKEADINLWASSAERD